MIFVYIFIGMIITLLIIAAFLPRLYHIEKTIIIRKPVVDVMKKVSDLNEYAAWNPWQQSEPKAIKTITGTAGTAGHQYSWRGKKVGAGTLAINSIDERHIHFDVKFIKPWKAMAKDNWLLRD
jgi:hypothetical protein